LQVHTATAACKGIDEHRATGTEINAQSWNTSQPAATRAS